jgi:O-antigen/teichoic acid export membrane protein
MANPVGVPGAMRGSKAGFVVFIGIAAANFGNYLFHLLAARALGTNSYADLAALVALAGLIALPLGGLQAAVARDVALLSAYGVEHAVAARIRRALVLAGLIGAVGTLIFLALAPVLQDVLDIESLNAVMLAALLTAPAFLSPIVWGWAQGLQRFVVLSFSVAVAPAVRLVVLGTLLAAGLTVGSNVSNARRRDRGGPRAVVAAAWEPSRSGRGRATRPAAAHS